MNWDESVKMAKPWFVDMGMSCKSSLGHGMKIRLWLEAGGWQVLWARMEE